MAKKGKDLLIIGVLILLFGCSEVGLEKGRFYYTNSSLFRGYFIFPPKVSSKLGPNSEPIIESMLVGVEDEIFKKGHVLHYNYNNKSNEIAKGILNEFGLGSSKVSIESIMNMDSNLEFNIGKNRLKLSKENHFGVVKFSLGVEESLDSLMLTNFEFVSPSVIFNIECKTVDSLPIENWVVTLDDLIKPVSHLISDTFVNIIINKPGIFLATIWAKGYKEKKVIFETQDIFLGGQLKYYPYFNVALEKGESDAFARPLGRCFYNGPTRGYDCEKFNESTDLTMYQNFFETKPRSSKSAGE